MLSFLLSPLYRVGAIIVVIFSALAVVYGKGRSDASAKAKLKTYKETQDAIERASRARARVLAYPSERLHDNDGHRRD
jgi:hypothetical protein